MKTLLFEKDYDVYDPWSTPLFGNCKMQYYKGGVKAKAAAAFCYFSDLIAPDFVRKILHCPKNSFPHVVAMLSLSQTELSSTHSSRLIQFYKESNVSESGFGWGLPFAWYSKNGVYDAKTAYITNTPYVMESLLMLAEQKITNSSAQQIFNDTWYFLESLQVMYEDEHSQAVSYSTNTEPRIVVNANSYALFAFAMHSKYGLASRSEEAKSRSLKIAKWIVDQQNSDGSWNYYADDLPGNFIDCFHSCFVIKNLIKSKRLVPELGEDIEGVLLKAKKYIDEQFFDSKKGLCRRFTVADKKDFFKWDLYDQSEYLGILLDFDELDKAVQLRKRIQQCFSDGSQWWCRINCLGQRWGKNYRRWGIAPFALQSSRLDRMIAGAS